MKFIRMEIENFRQYGSKQTIDFATKSKKNFTVINGENGCGKTNFLSAVNWCFYGDEGAEDGKYEKTKKLAILNESVYESMSGKEKKEVYVKIFLGENESPNIVLERRKVFRKSEEGTIELLDENFKILKKNDGGFKEEENRQVLMKQILPKEIRSFFFFDGEKLDSFFKIGSGTNIKEAIFDVSQIELINRTINHIEKVSREIERKVDNVSPIITKKLEEKDYCLEKKEDLDKQKKAHEKSISQTEKEVEEIEDYLRKFGRSDVSSMQKERDDLKKEYEEVNQSIVDKKDKIKDLVVDNYSTVPLLGVINGMIKEIDKLDKQKKLPPEIKPKYLEKILDMKKCICGRCIEEKSKEFEKIFSLIDQNSFGDNALLLVEGRSVLNRVKERKDEALERIKVLNLERIKYEKRIGRINKRNEEITILLKGIDEEKISKKETRKTMLFNALVSEKAYLASCKNRIIEYEEEISDLTKDLDELRRKSGESNEVLNQSKMLSESSEILKSILHEIVEEVRNTIQIKTEEYFFSMIWNKESFKKVRIDEDYNLSVINTYGSECLHSLSSGQRQVLALSFMAALKEVSGFNAPVIIDTPLGRISGEPRDNIAKNLPDYLKDTQVTLLVTDTEYTTSFKDKIKDRTGIEYRIKLNKKTGSSVIVKDE
jgi:DNA sulfur modification protein DndD